jgi:diaminohydroxyphosphoribosylaminopyrimidine deaminase / 5-amino-6-(5-phosphoribosylamino)uracil reductase
MTPFDERFMRAALAEARKGLGLTSPNPAVGALLVTGGKIAARGHHEQAGLDHAEIKCLKQLGVAAPTNSMLYLTLEPCSTTGRTPPCTDAIIAARINEVVIGALDPNPRHAGRGIDQLRRAGVQVRVGVLSDECAMLNEGFNKWIQNGRPFVIAKCGMSLDGRLTRPPNETRWLTSAEARRHAQQLRAEVDAVLIGAETLRQDDPRLTFRGRKKVKQPLRVVLSHSRKLPPEAKLFRDRYAARTLVYSGKSLRDVLDDLGGKEITSVLIEGGGDVLGQALDGRLIDKIQLYLAPLLTGGPVIAFSGKGAIATANALRLTKMSYQRIDGDLCITGYPCQKSDTNARE